MKLFTIVAIVAAFFSASVNAWPVDEMNKVISSTNFIVGSGCSGTLISTKYSLILTNHHCIGEGFQVRTKSVTNPDGSVVNKQVEELQDMNVSQKMYDGYRQVGSSSYKAEIVARWKESDLALLKVRTTLPNSIEAPIFSGSFVLRGSTVYVVGNPLMLDASVTKGVVSSTTRTFRVPWADAEVPFIQVDAGITGGNSGGALFDDNGNLIGVPAAGVPATVVGLAIPFFQIQTFLTDNCYGSVWDQSQAPFEECVAAKKATEKTNSAD